MGSNLQMKASLNPLMLVACFTVLVATFVPGYALAQDESQESEAPESEGVISPFANRIHFFRFLEDYGDITEDDKSGDWFASVKHVSILGLESAYASFGGQFRYRYENHKGQFFGLVPNPDYNLRLQRYQLHADVHWHESLRTFVEFSAFESQGRPGTPLPFNESEVDVHQAFVDFGGGNRKLRIGRQEIVMGSGLMLAIREGFNQRQNFDGARFDVSYGSQSQFSLVFAKDVVPENAAFEDSSNGATKVWGVYGSRLVKPWQGADLDIYYLGMDRPLSIYNSGTAREKRHAVGAWLRGSFGAIGYDYEGMYQFGDFGSQDITAWGVRTEHSYQLSNLALSPRITLGLNAMSGDSDPADGTLGTFEVFFPDASYLTEAATLRPRNLSEVHPAVGISPMPGMNISVGVNYTWRQNRDDAVFASGGFPIVAEVASNDSYIGAFIDLEATWAVNPHLFFKAVYVDTAKGDVINDVKGEDFTYFMIQTIVKF